MYCMLVRLTLYMNYWCRGLSISEGWGNFSPLQLSELAASNFIIGKKTESNNASLDELFCLSVIL